MTKKLKYFLSSVVFAALLAAVCLFLPSLGTPVSADDADFFYTTQRSDLNIVNDKLTGFRDDFDATAHERIKLVVPEGVTEIGENAFKDNARLVGELEIPASVTTVGASAFEGCTGMTSVKFANDAGGSLAINTNAFNGCSAMTVAELPVQLSNFGQSVFAGSGLSAVYMHNSSSVTFDSGSTDYFPASALIIFDDWVGYALGTADNNLSLFQENMTFKATVTFHHGNGVDETVERLAGKSFDFVKRADGTWATAAAGFVPVQQGYTVSAWYDTPGFNNEPFYSNNLPDAVDKVNTVLAAKPSGEVNLNYYANYINQPAIDTVGLVYDENTTYGEQDLPNILAGGFDRDAMAVKLVGKQIIDNAGDYDIRITLYPNFGEWEQPYDTRITVQRKTIRLSDYLDWRGGRIDETSGTLLSGEVYIYTKGAETVYSYTMRSDLESDGYERSSSRKINSVMRNLNDDVAVSLAASPYFTAAYTDMVFNGVPVADGENVARDEGKYVAKAVVTAGRNYQFISEANNFVSRGLNVDIAADRTQALLTKEWYLLTVGNGIYVKDTTNSYTISGWTFKETVNINRPELQFPADAGDFTFDLTLTTEGRTHEIAHNVAVDGDQFSNYVNVSMPAGDYKLTFHVPTTFDGGTEYPAYDATYSFRVAPAAFDPAWGEDVAAKLADAEWMYKEDADGNPILQLYSHANVNAEHAVELDIWDAFNSANRINPTRRGFWERAENSRFYSDRFYLTYNLSRMQNKTYYSFDELNGLAERNVPKAVDDYIIYYQLKAHNYEPLVDENDDAGRRLYKFNLTVYEVVEAPVIGEVFYTGSDVKPAVPFDRRYSATYNDANGYIKSGVHTITLTSTDPVHYRWAEGAAATEADHTIQFTISRAQNASKRLDVFGWNYGGFDGQRDTPRLETVFGTDSDYEYKLVAENGKVYELKDFNKAPAATYTLKITVKGYDENDPSTESYDWLKLELESSVRVLKAINRWVTTPTLASWTAGSYNPDENKVVGETTLGGEFKIIINVAGDLENVVYDSEKGIDNLSGAGAGLYRVSVVVAETDDFSEISHTFNIRVFERPGLPWWAIVLIVLGSFGVAALVIYILQRKGVLQILTGRIVFAMRTKATVDATIAAIRANKKAEEAKLSLARARAEDAREARRQQMLEEKNKTIDEQAAALDEQVKKTEMKANKLSKRAENIRKKADKLKDQASKTDDAANTVGEESAEQAEPAEDVKDNAPSEETPNSEE